MPRERDESAVAAHVRLVLTAIGEGAPSLDERVALARAVRERSEAQGREVDRVLVAELMHAHAGLHDARTNLDQLRGVLEKLTATPWYPAVYLGPVATAQGPRVLVMHGNTRRVVMLGDDVPADSLNKGDEVFLGNQLNVVMAKSPFGVPQWGEVASFDHKTADGRIVLQLRGDEKVIVTAGHPLADVELQSGDLVRWHRDSWMAFEVLPRVEGNQFLMEDVPDIARSCIGGQDAALDTLFWALTATLIEPHEAALYGLAERQSILMIGPSGCGKTLMARVVAAELKRRSGKRCRFAVVKPGEWEDPHVGVTQQRIRSCFEALRRAAEDGIVVLFLDEVETVGRIRGGLANMHADKFLGALLAELDGFSGLPNVAVVAATNRKDLIDPALLERLSDIEILVNRPDMRDARAIFGIHLAESFPYSTNGGTAAATRRAMIDTAVPRFYSPNAGNELCVIRLRDGKTRTVAARELASGRCFEQICRAARRAAFRRSVSGGEKGLCVGDIETALSAAIERLATTLTPGNARAYLADLPQDVDVVSVDPIVRRVSRPHRYLNVA